MPDNYFNSLAIIKSRILLEKPSFGLISIYREAFDKFHADFNEIFMFLLDNGYTKKEWLDFKNETETEHKRLLRTYYNKT